MKVIGVTGGIASGKSLVSGWFEKSQIKVIDSDHVYKNLVKTNQDLYHDVTNHFGLPSQEDQRLDYKTLASIVFNDRKKLKELNHITHPYVKDEINRLLDQYKEDGEKIVVLDVPLLFEANMESFCDVIICVYTDRETQIDRLMKRGYLDRETAIQRIDSQMSLEEKKEKSDYVIDNSLSKDESYRQFREILAKINHQS